MKQLKKGLLVALVLALSMAVACGGGDAETEDELTTEDLIFFLILSQSLGSSGSSGGSGGTTTLTCGSSSITLSIGQSRSDAVSQGFYDFYRYTNASGANVTWTITYSGVGDDPDLYGGSLNTAVTSSSPSTGSWLYSATSVTSPNSFTVTTDTTGSSRCIAVYGFNCSGTCGYTISSSQ